MSSDNKKTTGERKNKLEELAAKRREENEEDVDKLKNKPKSATSTPSSSKATTPIKASKVPKQPPPSAAKAKGVRPPRQDQYEVDGFIVDDENEEGEEPETGSDDVMSGELSVSESSGSGSEDDKKKKKKGNPKQKNITKNKQKKRTTKRKKDEDSDDDDSEDDSRKKSSKKKKGGSDSEELDSEKEKNDLLEDLEVIDSGSIVKGRTRGKKIDFTGMDPYDDE